MGECLTPALQGELFTWRDSAHGRLAEIILVDQFPRNIFRDIEKFGARSFAGDLLALTLSQEAVREKVYLKLNSTEQAFMFMPHMHSESRRIHEEAVKLFSLPGLEFNLEFERKHKSIIDRFGRFPHRNKAYGRPSTDEEIEFLKTPESSF